MEEAKASEMARDTEEKEEKEEEKGGEMPQISTAESRPSNRSAVARVHLI